MSVALDTSTVLQGLWPPQAKEPLLMANGRFLQLRFNTTSSSPSPQTPFAASCIAFHARDETQAVIGTRSGHLFGVSLSENKVFLLGQVSASPVRSVVFAGPARAPHVFGAAGDNTLFCVDWLTAEVHMETHTGAHSRQITAVVACAAPTAASAQTLVCLSHDAVSCWAPRRVPVADGDVATSALPSSPDGSRASTESLTYVCTGSAKPVQRQTPLTDGDVARSSLKGAAQRPLFAERALAPGGSHRFLSAHIVKDLLFTIQTNGVVAKWRAPLPKTASSGSGDVSVELLACVETVPFIVFCSSCGSAFLALGCRDLPAVALVNTNTMEGLGVFQLEFSASTQYSSPPAAKIQSIAVVADDFVFCALNNGRVVCVKASSQQVTMVLNAPRVALERRFSRAPAWSFTPSGPTYGAFLSDGCCVWVHLPTAKAYFERCVELCTATNRAGGIAGTACTGDEGFLDVAATAALHTQGENGQSELFTFTVKCVPFLSERQDKEGGRGLACAQSNSGCPSRHASVADSAALSRYRFPRKSLNFNPTPPSTASPRASWIDVNTAGSGGAVFANGTSAGVSKADQRTLSVLAHALYSDALGDAACAYNMEKLREHLTRYGVFPDTFRPAIWRFVLGLPNRRVTAARYAAYARRPQHVCVPTLMLPFPLPYSPVRSAVEEAVSVLAHHEEAFAMADFAPSFAYPFLRVFSERDVQSVVEVLLVFLSNWGQEFFVCYPQPPPALTGFLQRRLSAHDPLLARHFDNIGCDAALWAWQMLLSLYTDVLTSAEWLQVMDHAFMMQPVWLFSFHIALLILHRQAFLSCQRVDDVLSLLSTPFSAQRDTAALPRGEEPRGRSTSVKDKARPSSLVADAIEMAYALEKKCPRDDPVFATYGSFIPFPPSFTYPSGFPVNEEVLARRLKDLDELEAAKQEDRRAAARLQCLTKEAERAAVQEETLLQQQRASIAAKYDASAETWSARVELERARQEREAKERELRLHTLRNTVGTAEELERIQEQMASIDTQERHAYVDRLMEQHKWTVGASLTEEELTRLEHDARARVAKGLHGLIDGDSLLSEEAAEKQGGSARTDPTVSSESPAWPPPPPGPREAPDEPSLGEKRNLRTGVAPTTGVDEAAGLLQTAPTTSNRPYEDQPDDAKDGDSARRLREADEYHSTAQCTQSRSTAVAAEPTPENDSAPMATGDVSDARVPLPSGDVDGHDQLLEQRHSVHSSTSDVQADAFVGREGAYAAGPYGDNGVQYAELNVAPQEPRPADLSEDLEGYTAEQERGPSAAEQLRTEPKTVPLPAHLASFVPSAELLKALQTYKRHHAVTEASAAHDALPDRVRADPVSALYASHAGAAGSHSSVVKPYHDQFKILQEEVLRLREQARAEATRATSSHLQPRASGFVAEGLVAPSSAHKQPPSVRQQLAKLSRLRPLFDNLSDELTPTTTSATDTGSAVERTTRSSSRTRETATSTAHSASAVRTSVTSSSVRSTSRPLEGHRHIATTSSGSQLQSRGTDTSSQTAEHTSTTPYSSAASVIERRWGDDGYYWQVPPQP